MKYRRMRGRALGLLLPLSCGLLSGCAWDQYTSGGPPLGGVEPQQSVVVQAEGIQDARSGPAEQSQDMVTARELFRQQQYSRAEPIFHRLAETGTDRKDLWNEFFSFRGKKKQMSSSLAEEARYYEAECNYLQKVYPRAADTYVRLLNDFGSGTYREQACQRLFDIANYWLEDTREQMHQTREVREGKRMMVVPVVFNLDKSKPFFDQEGRALEILEQVRYNDIGGPFADKALFLLGSVHFFNENYREADHSFTQLVESHPNSSFAPQATELAIIAKHMCTGGSDYDGRKVAEARELVHKAQANYPQLAGDPDKRAFLERQLVGITLQQAEKDFKMAEFYRRTGKPCPAYFLYEVVIRRYPGTKYAELAQVQKDKLERENPGKLQAPPAGALASPMGPVAVPNERPAPPRTLPDLGQR